EVLHEWDGDLPQPVALRRKGADLPEPHPDAIGAALRTLQPAPADELIGESMRRRQRHARAGTDLGQRQMLLGRAEGVENRGNLARHGATDQAVPTAHGASSLAIRPACGYSPTTVTSRGKDVSRSRRLLARSNVTRSSIRTPVWWSR